MVQLSIDTCNSLCAVALSRWEDGCLQLVAQDIQDLGRGHAEVLTGQIADLLASVDVKPTDIERIAVTKGPGSFTGQRVGLASARVLAAALNIDAVGVGVLDALLLEAKRLKDDAQDGDTHKSDPQAFCAINDARRGAAYVKAWDRSGAVLIDDSLIPMEALPDALAALPKPLCLIGSGHTLLDLDTAGAWQRIGIALPGIASIAELGHKLDPSENPAEPLYLRGADAKPQSAKHVLRPGTGTDGGLSGAAL